MLWIPDFKQLDDLFDKSVRIPFNDSYKFVFMSDCHRSDGSNADMFIQNSNLYMVALQYYYKKKFIYIEVGDGDEIWANKNFSYITATNEKIFSILSDFYMSGRFYSIFGNHDIVKKKDKWARNNLDSYIVHHENIRKKLFPCIKVHEGIVLEDITTRNNIFILHGHQADFLNDDLWKLSRFFVRYLWRPLEIIGVKNPISPVNNYSQKMKIESSLVKWSIDKNIMVIAGHTHREVFPKVGEPMYFNDGCCVYPYFISAIEIENSEISSVRWKIDTKEDGTLFINRELQNKPIKINDYYKERCSMDPFDYCMKKFK